MTLITAITVIIILAALSIKIVTANKELLEDDLFELQMALEYTEICGRLNHPDIDETIPYHAEIVRNNLCMTGKQRESLYRCRNNSFPESACDK